MLHQPIENKKGGSTASIDYLLNVRVESGTARVIDGNEQLTRDIINSINYKQKVTVGVLSFEETNLPEETKLQIIEDFEKTLLPGLTKGEDYNILWVEHTDKGRLELNYAIPKIHLPTQKSLNPYYDRADRARIEIWRDIQNNTYNLSSPLDPAKRQTLNNDKRVEMFKDYKQLDKQLHDLVSNGTVESREQLVETLQNAKIEVTRQGKDYISIKLPEDKRAKKYKGGIYSEQFTSTEALRTIIKDTQREIRQYNSRDTQKEITRDREKLREYTEQKRDKYIKQYRKNENKVNHINNNNTNSNSINTANALSNEEINTNSRDTNRQQQQIRNQRQSIDDIRREQREDNKERELDIYSNRDNIKKGEIKNESNIYTESIERLRRERETKYNAYREIRDTRTNVYRRIKEKSKELREQSKELRERTVSHSRKLSNNYTEYADRTRRTVATTIKESESNLEQIERITTNTERTEQAITRYQQFRDFRNRVKSELTNFVGHCRESITNKFNSLINKFNSFTYKLQGTRDQLEAVNSKSELSIADIKQTRESIKENEQHNTQENANNQVQYKSRGMSR